MTRQTHKSGVLTPPNAELRNAYLGKMEDQLRAFDQKLHDLRVQLEGAKESVRDDVTSLVEQSRSKLDAVRDQLGELRKAGDDAFDDMKTAFERAWSDLRQSFEDARGKLS
jgi:chromosome segregation ATPase